MYSHFRLGIKYLAYWLTAKNGKGHGIHSPFVFEFVTLVLNDFGEYYCYDIMEWERKLLLENKQSIDVEDLGAGSRKGTLKQRKICDIAKNALKPPKYGKLLFRMANYFRSKTILELGTSLGVTTGYLSHANHASRVISMEGVPAIAAIAAEQFSRLGLNHVTLIQGNFDHTLEKVIGENPEIDLVYIDGNHRLEPTVRYFNQMFSSLHADSVVVFDDIHWSAEMEQAWEVIKADDRIMLTIDLFFIGIVFFKKEFKQKQHFKIRF
jgi:predicted O-methyltransferase YrrM